MTERSEALGRDPHEHTWLDLATLSADHFQDRPHDPPTAWDTGGNHSSTARIINVHNRKTGLLEG
jgi:hypothetical protein